MHLVSREFIHKSEIVAEHRIAGIIQNSIRSVDRKSLAWRATQYAVEIAFADSKLFPYTRRVLILDRPASGPCLWVIQSECIDGILVEIVCIQTIEPGLTKSLRNSTSTSEKVNCIEAIHMK